jgi:hypothetical protein
MAGSGQNLLGDILEKVRKDCVDDSEIENWISSTFELLDGSRKAMPTVELDVYRGKEKIETVSLAMRPVFIFGRNQQKCNVPLLHESISRQHAAIVIEKRKGVQIIDLGSRAGTKLDG